MMPSGLSRRGALAAVMAACVARPANAAAAAGVFRDDAELLARAYGALHPGLYRYNTPPEMAARFTALHTYLSVPRSLSEAYVAFARVTAAVRCGHSYPNFYNQSGSVRQALFQGRDRLPLHFRWLGERMIVTRDLSGSGLAAGSELVSVGGMPAAALLAALLPLARADGHNDAKRRRILEVSGADRFEAFDIYLPMLLPKLVAHSEVMVAAVSQAGVARRQRLRLMTSAERAAAAPSPLAVSKDAVLWRVERKAGGIACLTMPSWETYNGTWNWQGWLGARLDELASDGTRGLIVDLRGNEGGEDCGNPILARLVTRDLVAIGNGRRVRYRRVPADLAPHVDTWDDSFRDWGAQAVGPRPDGFYDLTRWGDDSKGDMLIRPAGRRFGSRMVVLVDATNSSATFQFAQVVKDHGLGTLIGETTGGNRRGINGGAFLFLRLPQSGIEVDIPLIGYFPPQPQPDAGIEPDIAVPVGVADVATGNDSVMAAAMRALA